MSQKTVTEPSDDAWPDEHAFMRLLTHNMLMSPGTKNGFPLGIEVEKMEEVEAEFSAEFTARLVAKIDYAALLSTLASVRYRSR